MRRLPARSIVAAQLQGIGSLVAMTALLVAYLVRPDMWLAQWAVPLIVALIVLRIGMPVYSWLAVTYRLAGRGLEVRNGVINSRRRSMTWSEGATIEVDAPWAFRLLGLSIVTIRRGGEDDTKIVLPGVGEATARTIEDRLEPPRATVAAAAEASSSDDAVATPATAEVVYRASARDLVLASIVYGHVILWGAAGGLALFDLADTLGLGGMLMDAGLRSPVAAVVLGAIVCLAGGIAVTVVRFSGFAVSRTPDGDLVIEYGLLDRRRRVVRASAIVGIRTQRNLFEAALDRARASLLTTDSATQTGTNLVLPSLSRADVRRLSAMLVGEDARLPSILEESGRRRVPVLLLIGVVAIAGGVGTAALLAPTPIRLVGAIVCGVIVMILIGAAARVASARLASHDPWITYRWAGFADHVDVTHESAVHVIRVLHQRTRFGLVRVYYFAGRARAMTAVVRRALDHAVVEWLEAVPGEIVRHQMRKVGT